MATRQKYSGCPSKLLRLPYISCSVVEVFTVRVERKMNEVVNRLNRTKELRRPNLREEREERDREETVDKRRRAEEQVGLLRFHGNK